MIEKTTLNGGCMKKKILFSFLLLFLLFPLFSTWDGLYRWVNTTEKDNKGKVREITMRVKSTDKSFLYEIYLISDGREYKIFPLVEPSDVSYDEWHNYGEESSAGEAFRYNNERMNKTIINPAKWKMGRIDSSEEEIITTTIAFAFFINIEMESKYSFSLDEKGSKQLTFSLDGLNAIAKGKFFVNPEKGSNGIFTLHYIEEDAL